MAHIFVSYSHDDRDFALLVAEKLKSSGFEYWLDSQLNAGDDWRQSIDRAIQKSSVLIVVVTPQAKVSEYVTYEWAYALGYGISVVPIMLKPTVMHPRLEALQYLDFANSKQYPWEKLISQLAVQSKISRARVPQSSHRSLIYQGLRDQLDKLETSEEIDSFLVRLVRHREKIDKDIEQAILEHPRTEVRLWGAIYLAYHSNYRDKSLIPHLQLATFSDNREIIEEARVSLENYANYSPFYRSLLKKILVYLVIGAFIFLLLQLITFIWFAINGQG